MLARLIKFTVFMGFICFIGVVGYSFIGDMSAHSIPKTVTVTVHDG